MKKILLLAITLLTVMTAGAQNEQGEASITPRAGLNLATLAGDKDGKLLPSYALGFDVEWGLTNNLGLTAGLFFSQQGEKDKTHDLTLRLGYVNVPFTVHFYPIKRLAFKAGVQIGFLASKKAKQGDTKIDFDRLEAMKILPKEFNNVDVSIPMGISYEIKNFMLDVRYNMGLTRVFKESAGYDSYRNSVIQFSLGYRFSLGD